LWQTDVATCGLDQVDIVTDISGSTNATDERFSETSNVLTIKTNAVLFEDIFIRSEGFVPTVFNVKRV